MAQIVTCPIWGKDYEATGTIEPAKDWFQVDSSDRAGGAYRISGGAEKWVNDLELGPKARLTTWLIEQRLRGEHYPNITVVNLKSIVSRAPLAVHERASRLLRYFSVKTETLGKYITFGDPDDYEAYAWSESFDPYELQSLLKYLKEMGWIEGSSIIGGGFTGTLSVNGYAKIEDIAVNVDLAQAFVAMWLHDSMTATYKEAIEPAICDAGYKPMLITQKPFIDRIEDQVIAEIRRSRFVVADLTHDDKGARGSVYYEAGFAHGLGLDVIFTCRKDSFDDAHFDINHFNFIVWDSHEGLRKHLTDRIRARMY